MQDSKRDTDVKNRLSDSVGEGKGGTDSDNSNQTCILPRVKETTRASSMHKAGHCKLLLCDNPEGWPGREVGGGSRRGTRVFPRLTHVNLWQTHNNVISLQSKFFKNLKKKKKGKKKWWK